MKFKVGDKVRVIRETSTCFNEIGIIETDDKSNVPFKVRFNNGLTDWNKESDLAPTYRTIDDVQKGDVIENEYGKRKVIEVLGDIVFLSFLYNYESSSCWVTKKELEEDGYSLVQPQETCKFESKKYNLEQVREAIEGLEEVE